MHLLRDLLIKDDLARDSLLSEMYASYKNLLGEYFSKGNYDDLLALVQGGLTNDRLLNESLLWVSLVATKKNEQKHALAALMCLALRDSSSMPIKLLSNLFEQTKEDNSDAIVDGILSDQVDDVLPAQNILKRAHLDIAAEWYRSTPTEFDAFFHYVKVLITSKSIEDQKRARQLLNWHLPELEQIQSIVLLLKVLPANFLPEFGAVSQKGDALSGWVAVESHHTNLQLVIATGGKQMLVTPNVVLYQDKQWAVFKVEVLFAQQGMEYQSVQVGVLRDKTQPVKVLVGCPLIWMPNARPNYSEKTVGQASLSQAESSFNPQSLSTKSNLSKRKISKTHITRSKARTIGSPVDVIIPVFANREMTLACIQSVLANVSVNITPQRILVVNDASPEPLLIKDLQELADNGLIEILHHTQNMGFIGSINHGLSVSSNDVVLLNSDTLVHGNWLDRLQKVAYSADKVASVTPFTNNGELMSLLAPCDPAPALTPQQLAELDNAAAIANVKDMSVRLGSGCGFCFYMTRNALIDVGGLDPTLKRGYGEESDWSYLASNKGWQHLGAMNTVVAHQGGVSFGDEKRFRVKQNLKTIEKRYPDSSKNFKTCLRRDPMSNGRNKLRRVWLHEQANNIVNPIQQSSLRIVHSLALAERFLAESKSGSQSKQAIMLARIDSAKITLTGIAPHPWRIQYRLPQQVTLLQQDLQKLGLFQLSADTPSLQRWWQSAFPMMPVTLTSCLQREEKDEISLPSFKEKALVDWKRQKNALILAVVGQEEAFASEAFLNLANLLASKEVPVYLMPSRYPSVNVNALLATGHIFPTPFALSRQDERVDFYRQSFPLDGVLILDSLATTLEEASLLDNANRNLTWFIVEECLEQSKHVIKDGYSPFVKESIVKLKSNNLVWLSELSQIAYNWSCHNDELINQDKTVNN